MVRRFPEIEENLTGWVNGWWEEAFPLSRNPSEIVGHSKGSPDMLIVIAYDICDPKRLKRVAETCMNFGVRVQYSVFECRLTAEQFNALWEQVCHIAERDEDRIVAYPIFANASQNIRTFGTMVSNDKVIAYVF
ncbi:MAG: CRISPR-associated endonuclease Cas2 [Puniceicoccaceae bacterium]